MCLLLCLVTKSCPTLCNPIDYSPPGSSVHGISKARILEWVAISLSRGSSQSRDQSSIPYISCIVRWILNCWTIREAHYLLLRVLPISRAQSCPTLCYPMDCSLPGSSFCPWDSPGKNTGVDCHSFPDPGIESVSVVSPALAGRFFTTSATWEASLQCGCSVVSSGITLFQWFSIGGDFMFPLTRGDLDISVGILWFVITTENVLAAFGDEVVDCGASSVMPRKSFIFFKNLFRHNPHTRHQQSPTFLAPGTGFVEAVFPQSGVGDGFGMNQGCCIYCALYFYYDYISATSGHPSGIRSQRLGTPDYIVYLKYINSQTCMTPTTSSEHFYHHKKIPCAHHQSLPNHPILQLWANTKLFSVSINLPFVYISYKQESYTMWSFVTGLFPLA